MIGTIGGISSLPLDSLVTRRFSLSRRIRDKLNRFRRLGVVNDDEFNN